MQHAYLYFIHPSSHTVARTQQIDGPVSCVNVPRLPSTLGTLYATTTRRPFCGFAGSDRSMCTHCMTRSRTAHRAHGNMCFCSFASTRYMHGMWPLATQLARPHVPRACACAQSSVHAARSKFRRMALALPCDSTQALASMHHRDRC